MGRLNDKEIEDIMNEQDGNYKGFHPNLHGKHIMDDIDDWQRYCSTCIWFNTDRCPHLGEVGEWTIVQEIKCKNFWD